MCRIVHLFHLHQVITTFYEGFPETELRRPTKMPAFLWSVFTTATGMNPLPPFLLDPPLKLVSF